MNSLNHTHFCQSCSMPLDDPELRGTERDGSKSNKYCRFCYADGLFTNPEITLEEMRSSVMHQMDSEKIPVDIIESAVTRLPSLERWRNTY